MVYFVLGCLCIEEKTSRFSLTRWGLLQNWSGKSCRDLAAVQIRQYGSVGGGGSEGGGVWGGVLCGIDLQPAWEPCGFLAAAFVRISQQTYATCVEYVQLRTLYKEVVVLCTHRLINFSLFVNSVTLRRLVSVMRFFTLCFFLFERAMCTSTTAHGISLIANISKSSSKRVIRSCDSWESTKVTQLGEFVESSVVHQNPDP